MRCGVLVLAVVVLLMAGCAGPHYQREQLLVGRALPGAAGSAHPNGTLHYNSSGCVAIGDVVVVAPAGSSLIDDGIILIAASAVHPTDRQLHVGGSLPREVRGVRVDRGSRLLPRQPDRGASAYFVIT